MRTFRTDAFFTVKSPQFFSETDLITLTFLIETKQILYLGATKAKRPNEAIFSKLNAINFLIPYVKLTSMQLDKWLIEIVISQ